MAWTTPRTANFRDFYTVGLHNTDTRDNLREIWHTVATGFMTSNVTASSSFFPGQTILSASFTSDGTSPTMVSVFLNEAFPSAADSVLRIHLRESGGATYGELAYVTCHSQTGHALMMQRRMIFPAGARSVVVTAWAYTNPWTIFAGSGNAAGSINPGWIEIKQKGG